MRVKPPPHDPLIYLSTISRKAGVSNSTITIAAIMVREIMKRRLHQGRNPVAVMAACLWMACLDSGQWMPQRLIAKAAGISLVCLNQTVRALFGSKVVLKQRKRHAKQIQNMKSFYAKYGRDK